MLRGSVLLWVLLAGCSSSKTADVSPPPDADGGATGRAESGVTGGEDASLHLDAARADAAADARADEGKHDASPTPDASPDALPDVQPDAAAADAALPPPWNVLDLTGWALDVPVNAMGQLSGTNDATIIEPIDASFPAADAPYFHSVAGGGVLLYAPVDGATTTNSYYPRCELAEKGYSEAHGGMNWPLSLGGTMKVTMSVDSAPSIHGGTSNGDLVIGQIKGVSSELCKVRYTGGSELIGGTSYAIYVEYNNATVSGDFGLVPVASRIPPNAKLSYEIKLANNSYTVSITYGGATFSGSSGTLDASWASDTYYFKAGVYTQANSAGQGGDTEGTGAGEVTLYSLDVTHP